MVPVRRSRFQLETRFELHSVNFDKVPIRNRQNPDFRGGCVLKKLGRYDVGARITWSEELFKAGGLSSTTLQPFEMLLSFKQVLTIVNII